MYTLQEIQTFVNDTTGVEIPADGDIFGYRVGGDDFHEMMEKYASTFSVNMDGYLWYFHADEEGQNIGGLFYPPPYHRVKRIPITPKTLLEFANKGRWGIEYPEHVKPTKRPDLLVNRILAFVMLIVILWTALRNC